MQSMAANGMAMVWPLEGQGTGSRQPGSQQVVAGLDAHEHTLAESAMALCVEEAVKLSQRKSCSLYAVCVNMDVHWKSSVGLEGVCEQLWETVLALNFLFCFSNFFFLLELSSFKQA